MSWRGIGHIEVTRGGFGNGRLVGRRSAGLICAVGTDRADGRAILGKTGSGNFC